MKTKFNNSGLLRKVLLMSIIMGTFLFFSCESNAQKNKENEKTHIEGEGHDKDGENHGEERKNHDNDEHKENTSTMRGEHSRDTGGSEEGEEDGTEFGLNDTYDVTKHGVRLILKYDKKSNSFIGSMANTTNAVIKKARVEVHLSNGTELGPTTPIDVGPKMKKEIVLKATKASFDGWTTHAEIGNLEEGHNEGKEGHESREAGEHGNKDREHK